MISEQYKQKEKRKILIFHQSLAPYRIDLWNSLNESYDIKIFFIYKNHLDQKFDQERLRSQLNFKPSYLDHGISIGVRALRWGFKKIIDEFHPDIIFTYEYSQTTTSLFLLKKAFKYKFNLYSICDDSLDIAQTCSGLRKLFRDFLAPRLDGLILGNPEIANWYSERFGSEKKRIVFPIIAKEERFRYALEEALPISNHYLKEYDLEGKKCVFYVGRLVTVKGIDRLLRAFESITKDDPDVRLILIGNGSQRSQLIDLTFKLKIGNSVIFPGRFEGPALQAWYNLAQIFVLPSHYEPFGAVVNEALMAGSFVLCSRVAGAAYLISPGLNGEVFNPFSIEALGELLLKALEKVKPLTRSIDVVKDSHMLVTFDDFFLDLCTQLNNGLND